ncbi:MAG: HAD-IA family hydrolase [Lachnospiraceae bacterium]
MDKQYILFDLDGTLTDPMEGITKSAQHALKHFGIEVKDHTSLAFFIGPPLRDTFKNHYHMSDGQVDEAIRVFREYFEPKGIFENEIYDGVPKMLENLTRAGRSLILATSKPVDFAERVLEYFDIKDYFDFVAGSSMDERRANKEEIIAYALEECQLIDMSELVMVGDRKYDIEAAKEFGIYTIGVLYGYGSKAELKKAGADCLVKTVDDLEEVLLEEE